METEFKTKRGYNISIKDNKVYINGKIAPIGYKFHDKSNGTTYRVGLNGVYEPIKVRGKKVLSKFPIVRHATIRTPNVENPTTLPDGPFKIYNAGLAEVNRKYLEEEKYFVPRSIPGVPSALVTTGQRFNGVDIPYNLLDSVAKYVLQVPGISLEEGLGLLGETSAGQAPVATLLTPTEIRLYQEHPAYLQYSGDRKELGYYPTDIINNHHYYLDNPYNAYINTLIRLGKISGTTGIFKPYWDFDKTPINPEDLDPEIVENAAYHYPRFKYLSEDNPWIDAFLYLRDYNYGMGEWYRSNNRKLGEELLKDSEIQKWKALSKFVK